MNRRTSVLTLLLLVCGFALTACEFKVSTANIDEAKLARSVDAEMNAVDPTTTFATTDKEVHALINLANAPEDTDVLGIWRDEAGQELARKNVVAGGSNSNVHLSLTAANGMPPGKYRCDVYINRLASDTTVKPDRTLNFEVQ